jgi:hypothetical protein
MFSGGGSLSVELRSRKAAILVHDAARYFNVFLSAGSDARPARSRHCLARRLYSATTRMASILSPTFEAGEPPCGQLQAVTARTYNWQQNPRVGDEGDFP